MEMDYFEVVIIVVVEIFTTEGINFSAKSANDSGTFWNLEYELKTIIKVNKNVFILIILNFLRSKLL